MVCCCNFFSTGEPDRFGELVRTRASNRNFPNALAMLDLCAIFSRGGVLLWARQTTTVKGDPINALVGHILEGRGGETQFSYAPGGPGTPAYTIRWTLDNKLGLVFAAVYQKSLSLPYSAGALMGRVAKVFAQQCPHFHDGEEWDACDFDTTFDKLLREAEHAKKTERGGGKTTTMAGVTSPTTTTTGVHTTNRRLSERDGIEEAPAADAMASRAFDADMLSKRFGGSKKKAAGSDAVAGSKATNKATTASKAAKAAKATKATKAAKGREKKARDWGDLDGIKRDDDKGQLEFVDGSPEEVLVESFTKGSLIDVESEDSSEDDDVYSEGNGDGVDGRQPSGFLGSLVRNLGMSVVGTDALKRSDIDLPLEVLKKKLMERNVAEDISNKMIESVAASLVGSRLGSFSRISSAVRTAMEEALTRVLTPRKPIDILRGIAEAKARGRPYVIAFVGVNGVGKSTSLAKVAYYLKQHNHRVMVAACDTFRSGAVEQVRVHSQRLGLSLYARGYEKDPAKVASEAIRAAQKEGCDVVLVDTAGRMQNNEPLMRAITSLVSMNSPDLVLFVGEALAGNDSVDQVVLFNKALATYSTVPNPHIIDGLIISKFETVDEKIGTAISMVFCSGAPIAFLGVGQQYTDLKKLDVRKLVKTLLQ